jgi:hypothetical protein
VPGSPEHDPGLLGEARREDEAQQCRGGAGRAPAREVKVLQHTKFFPAIHWAKMKEKIKERASIEPGEETKLRRTKKFNLGERFVLNNKALKNLQSIFFYHKD